MPYHSILGYIFLSLSLSIMLYLQYTKNKHQKVTFSEFGERLTPNTQFRF